MRKLTIAPYFPYQPPCRRKGKIFTNVLARFFHNGKASEIDTHAGSPTVYLAKKKRNTRSTLCCVVLSLDSVYFLVDFVFLIKLCLLLSLPVFAGRAVAVGVGAGSEEDMRDMRTKYPPKISSTCFSGFHQVEGPGGGCAAGLVRFTFIARGGSRGLPEGVTVGRREASGGVGECAKLDACMELKELLTKMCRGGICWHDGMTCTHDRLR